MTATAQATWHPIESAPKDTAILVYTKPWGAIIARFSDQAWLSRMQVPVSIREDAELPTHWQPLPDPPGGADADAGAPRKDRGATTTKIEARSGSR